MWGGGLCAHFRGGRCPCGDEIGAPRRTEFPDCPPVEAVLRFYEEIAGESLDLVGRERGGPGRARAVVLYPKGSVGPPRLGISRQPPLDLAGEAAPVILHALIAQEAVEG